MAELRTFPRRQVITSSIVNLNGQRIPNDKLDITRYTQNPILLYNASTEGHDGVVVGRVEDIRRESVNGNDVYTASLRFGSGFPAADDAWAKKEQGLLRFVSVGVRVKSVRKPDGTREIVSYELEEVSCVAQPANPQCDEIIAASVDNENEEHFITCSVEVADQESVEAAQVEAERIEAERIEAERIEAERIEAERIEAERIEAERIEAERLAAEKTAKDAADETARRGRTEHKPENKNKTNKHTHMNYAQLCADPEFGTRMTAAVANLAGGGSSVDPNPENAETLGMYASALLQDAEFVVVAANAYVTDKHTGTRTRLLDTLIRCTEGSETGATLAAADLAVIQYVADYYETLRTSNAISSKFKLVPMSDRGGVIYVEESIDVPVSIGKRTPVHTTVYEYEDTKRTLERYEIASKPVRFIHSELDVLAYDKRSRGIRAVNRKMVQAFTDYVLQSVAVTPGVPIIKTTGAATASQNKFPLEAPLSNVQMLKPTYEDVLSVESSLALKNYNLAETPLNMVMPTSIYYEMLQDEAVRNRLIKFTDADPAKYVRIASTRMTPRNPVIRYNTTSGAVEAEPTFYAQQSVANDGTVSDTTPAVTTENHVGAALAFADDAILAGVGGMEIFVERDPMSYGTLISSRTYVAATIARQNGNGVVVLAPSVSA